jgi:multisubunit Na+/H+ antiporter MnhF subunit
MTAQSITQIAVNFGLLVLSLSFLLAVWRVIRGPTLPDRVIALDMLVGIVMGFIALIAIRTGFTLYIDIAISLGLVGFLATVAFARFILSRKRREGEDGSPPEPLPERPGDRIDQPAAPEPAPIAPVFPTPSAASPAALAGSPRAPLSKSEVTKASAAKVKIAKAKARGQAAGAEAMPVAEAGAKAARPKPPRKPAVKVVVKPLAKSADKPEPKPEATPAPKKETP